jgi:hypothetical protein
VIVDNQTRARNGNIGPELRPQSGRPMVYTLAHDDGRTEYMDINPSLYRKLGFERSPRFRVQFSLVASVRRNVLVVNYLRPSGIKDVKELFAYLQKARNPGQAPQLWLALACGSNGPPVSMGFSRSLSPATNTPCMCRYEGSRRPF